MYNQSYNNGYYYSSSYGYGSQNAAPKDPFINREARHLTKLSLLAGAGVLGFVMIQLAVPYVLRALGLLDFYNNDFMFSAVVSVFTSVIGVMVPFYIASLFYSEKDRERCIDFGRPVSSRAFWLAVVAGLAVCLAGDYLSGGFTGFVSALGIDFKDVDLNNPSTAGQFFMQILQIAVVPAVAEEFAVRGVVMQPLRKYGDRFAIIMSSLIFALMHGNMLQIPFAFIAGIALGYFAISTGSIWTSVAIHLCNNLFSIILSTLYDHSSAAGFISTYLIVITAAAGIYCMVKFIKTEHYGLGFTRAPAKKKKALIIAFAVFLAVSIAMSVEILTNRSLYLLSAIALGVTFSRYNKANKKALNAPPASSLPKKLMVSLYCASPSVITGTFFLIWFTASFISIQNHLGTVVFELAIGAIAASVIYAIYTVRKSPLLENKTVYSVSIAVLIIIGLVTVFSSLAAGLVR
ncbi:MAG: CPBP family intramembrane metalloprotease [Clostridia bacterium]|nr:CPBP family intramembrane metalloprotease [Clostridia bacterium]